MQKSQMKVIAIVCIVVCVISIFTAVERYNTNAKKVRAMNNMMNNSATPVGGMMKQMTGQTQIKPSTPAATRYALLFAAVFGITGGMLLVKSSNAGQSN